jgi:squalene-associated FAD-dependent desaturase
MSGTVHIVGAGVAGLAAAVALCRSARAVVLHEATAHPGGRCRSYHDRGIDMVIDNGNHLVLSGNRAVRAYLREIGSEAGLIGPDAADFPFVDLASGRRWTLRINDGRLPWWVLDRSRRVPDTGLGDYLRLLPLLSASADATVCDTIRCDGPLYDRLIHPLLLAALNIDPQEGSAGLGAAIVRETLLAGGVACRPLVARDGLGPVFIEPALRHLKERGATVRLEHELRALRFSGDRAAELDFGGDGVTLGPADAVVLAVPAHAAAMLLPGLSTPGTYRSIANAHFRCEVPPAIAPMTAVLNATTEWKFAFPGRLSVTISNADRLMDMPRGALAQTIWQEVSKVTGIAGDMPPWQIVRERRATFAATPAENARRPATATRWRNLFLAGDWTATGLPATNEGAIRSGHTAAELCAAE